MTTTTWLTGCAELGSEHPLGSAIVECARKYGELYDPSDSKVAPGRGIAATVRTTGVKCDSGGTGAPSAASTMRSVLVGNRSWCKENGVAVSPAAHAAMQAQEVMGNTAVVVAVDGELVGVHVLHRRNE